MLDREMRYVRADDAFAEITGIPAEAHIGRRPMELPLEVAAAPGVGWTPPSLR